jgi:hypothetical protein
MDPHPMLQSSEEFLDQALHALPGTGTSLDEIQGTVLPEWVYEQHLGSIQLKTGIGTAQGREVRSSLSTVLLAQRLSEKYCSVDSTFDCNGFQIHAGNLKSSLLLSDRLASAQQGDAYRSLTLTIQPFLESLKGFGRGALKGSLNVAVGVAAVAFLPESVVLTAATATLSYGIYQGIAVLMEAEDGLKGIFRQKWREFSDATVERKAELLGEITTDVAGLLMGGRLVESAQQAFKKGAELALNRFVVQESVQELVAQNAISSELGATVNAFAQHSPVEASTLVQEGQTVDRMTLFGEIRNAIRGQSDSSASGSTFQQEGLLPQGTPYLSSHLSQDQLGDLRALNIINSAGSNIANLRPVVNLLREHNIPLANRREVIEAFTQESRVVRLIEDRTVYRYWTEGFNGPRGRWVTSELVENPHADLALPNGGPYQIQRWTIPAETEVIEGLASPNFGMPGGGGQIYVPNPGVLR